MPAPAKTGTITVNGSTSLGDASSAAPSYWTVQLFSTTFTGTITIDATVDGTNYYTISFIDLASTTPATQLATLAFTTGSKSGIYQIDATGLTDVRITAASVSAGSLAWAARPTIV